MIDIITMPMIHDKLPVSADFLETIPEKISCPFCGSSGIPAKPGRVTTCSGCHYDFFIDDRVECVFADPLIESEASS